MEKGIQNISTQAIDSTFSERQPMSQKKSSQQNGKVKRS